MHKVANHPTGRLSNREGAKVWMLPRSEGAASNVESGHPEVDESEPPAPKEEKRRGKCGSLRKRGRERIGHHRGGKAGSSGEGSKGESCEGGSLACEEN